MTTTASIRAINPALKREIRAAKKNAVPENYIQPRHPVRQAGLHVDRRSRPTTPTGIRRPTSPSPARTPTTRSRSTTISSRAVENDGDWNLTARIDGKVGEDAEGPRPVGKDRLCRLGLGRSGHPFQHHHQRLAHLRRPPAPIRASNPCSEYMFLDDTACNLASINLLPYRNADGTIDIARLRACGAAVDHRARNLGDDGAVPVEGDRRALLRIPHARPRLRQYRRPADDLGHPLRLATRAAPSAARSPRS